MLRETNVFPDLKKSARLSQMDLIFRMEAKGPHGSSEKYVKYAGFLSMLRKIACIKYPILTAEDAGGISNNVGSERAKFLRSRYGKLKTKEEQAEDSYVKLMMIHVTSIASWITPVWEEAKLCAMTIAAKRYCAATRIMAFYRSNHTKHYFSIYIDCIIILQAHVRRFYSKRKTRLLMKQIKDDWIFRFRIHSIVRIQAIVRRYLAKCQYLKMVSHNLFFRIFVCF